jgi:hypothetical protein
MLWRVYVDTRGDSGDLDRPPRGCSVRLADWQRGIILLFFFFFLSLLFSLFFLFLFFFPFTLFVLFFSQSVSLFSSYFVSFFWLTNFSTNQAVLKIVAQKRPALPKDEKGVTPELLISVLGLYVDGEDFEYPFAISKTSTVSEALNAVVEKTERIRKEGGGAKAVAEAGARQRESTGERLGRLKQECADVIATSSSSLGEGSEPAVMKAVLPTSPAKGLSPTEKRGLGSLEDDEIRWWKTDAFPPQPVKGEEGKAELLSTASKGLALFLHTERERERERERVITGKWVFN